MTVNVQIIGSSILSGVDAADIANATGLRVSVKNQLYTVQQATEFIRNSTASDIIIYCGGNNTKSEKAHTVIERYRRLEIVLKNNKNVKNVIICGLLCRRDSLERAKRAKLINAALKLICEANNWTYVDNANINFACLKNDGVHLAEKGTHILSVNIHNVLVKNAHFTENVHKNKI